jgi:hypothetical protein
LFGSAAAGDAMPMPMAMAPMAMAARTVVFIWLIAITNLCDGTDEHLNGSPHVRGRGVDISKIS